MSSLIDGSNRQNNFGFLRLLFAYLVIFGRSPDIIGRAAGRDPLFLLTGTIPLGDLAVDGFFLISGYLICQSFEHSKSFFNYLAKRVLRIYPAFVVVWLLTLFVLVPMSGGLTEFLNIGISGWLKNIMKMFMLSEPFVEGFLLLDYFQTLNGALWTIRYEFLCYLLIPVVALFGLNKKSVLALAILFIAAYITHKSTGFEYEVNMPFPLLFSLIARLFSTFLIGMAFYQFRDKIVWSMKLVVLSLVLVLLTINNPIMAEIFLVIFGGYIMFYFAFAFKNSFFQNCNVKNDISYGVYIYAWPVQALLVKYYNVMDPVVLAAITSAIVTVLGFLSWRFIEKPFLQLKSKI